MKGKKMTASERIAKLESDKIERRKIFKELCEHVGKGYSIESFPPLSVESVRKYLNTFKEEFVQEELNNAMRQGRDWWEGIGRRQASGDCLGNSRTWFYNMANRYGWREKIDIEAEHKGQVNVNVISYATKKASDSTESAQQP